MKAVIRYMTSADISKVVEYDKIIFGHTLGNETLRIELEENPFAHYFVLEDEESSAFLGMISLWIDTPNAQILNLYVLPSYQEHGLGRRLMDFSLDYVKSYEVEEMTLEVRPSNAKALSLYEQYGFKQVAIRRNYYENGEDAFLMYKRM